MCHLLEPKKLGLIAALPTPCFAAPAQHGKAQYISLLLLTWAQMCPACLPPLPPLRRPLPTQLSLGQGVLQ